MTRIHQRLAVLNPPPTREIPLLIGGGGERKTLRLVAEHAHVWHCFGDAATLQHKSGVLAGHCADVGRDPAEIEHSTELPSDASDLDGLADLGFTLFTAGVNGPDYNLAPVAALVAWRDSRNRG